MISEQELIYSEFKKLSDTLNRIYKNKSELFYTLNKNNFTRIECMILDSFMKGFSAEGINKTLLLNRTDYNNILANITTKVSDLVQSKIIQCS